MRIHRLIATGLIAIATGFAATTALANPQPSTARRYEACLNAFEVRVDEYWALHRRLESLLGKETMFVDPRADTAARMALADLMRVARPAAAEGDLFTPDVAEVFRVRIAHALLATRRTAAELLRAESGEDGEEWFDLAPPVVKGAFDWRWNSVMWPSILFALPPLPEDLEYRFVGTDLILVDVHANLVVDILRDALPVE